ncbi:MAG TPA: cytochrome c3 family protein [Longimicrobiales bacterium]|nr:cytochrome c3 family protein [Longimicrobiales bacterium]
MRALTRQGVRATLAGVLVSGVLAGCVDEKIVYRDRELFEEPLAAAGSFLGYSDQDSKLTVCGNCHVEKQGDWEQTAHAEAWVTLQASGGAQAFCEGCHTVNQRGNTVEEAAGYDGAAEDRYHDVQCESCHGPGLAHVTNPTDATVPLAPLQVAADPLLGCAECHSGAHHPFVNEWNVSRHGEGANAPQYRTRDGCSACHGGEGALAAWGVNTEYLEEGQGESIGITCSVCHDPHGSAGHEGQLRWAVDSRDVDQNLCMKCHQRRAVPDPGSSRGPHSPQGPLLLGQDVGWEPPNFVYSDQLIRGTHGSEANTRLCATCHVNAYEIEDEAGEFVFSATGHLFKPIPCVDEQGVPTADDSCGMTTAERTFASCTTAGCHGSEDAALSALLIAQARIANLTAELDALVEEVRTTAPDQFNTSDGVFTVAEGSNFNVGLGEIESSAVHNPFLTEALLTASIQAMIDTYGLAAPANLDRRNIMWELSLGGN